MRLALLTVAFSIFTLTAEAQVFEPGVLVTITGDTLRGEIENKFWEANPASIRFRPTASGPIASYSPAQLRSFQLVGSRYFRTETLPLDRTAETRTEFLQRRISSGQRPETVFAEVLIDGPAPLLRFVVPGVTHYFVRRENQPYIELTERKYLQVDRGGRLVVVDGNRYRIQLQQFFGDCAATAPLVAKARYVPTDLAAVVQAYNRNCSSTARPGQNFLARAHPERSYTLNAGLLAGVQFQSFRLQSSVAAGQAIEAPLFDGADIARRSQPVAGIYADVLQPSRKLALHSELDLSLLGKSGTLAGQGSVPTAEYRWKGTLLMMRLGIRYFVPLGARQTFFMGAGMSLDRFNITASSLRYGDGQPRQFAGYTLPRTGTLLGLQTERSYTITPPYVELGFRRGPLTVSVDTRPLGNGGGSYYDDMTIGEVFYDNQGQIRRVNTNHYSASFWLFNALVAYRLTKNRDTAPTPPAPAGR